MKRKEYNMKIQNYWFKSDKIPAHVRIALVADLHSKDAKHVIAAVEKVSPDVICIPGDLTEALDGTMEERNTYGFAALRAFCGIAPVYYAPGNHEIGACHGHMNKLPPDASAQGQITQENRMRILECGAHFLENSYTEWQGIVIGGLGSGMLEGDKKPRVDDLNDFFAHQGYKILLCHHPEYYAKYLRDRDVDMVLSGHAHGGQWRIFGRGVYAPDQGLFPKYTSGVHEGKLVISRGVSNTAGIIPRFFNPREVVCIHINEKEC